MIVGVPKEIKNHEYRVAMTPAGVTDFVRHGHEVLIESGAGMGSGFADESYQNAGARVLTSADQVWRAADMILKVKEPREQE